MERAQVIKRFKALSQSMELTVMDIKVTVHELDKSFGQINIALLNVCSVERGMYIDLPAKILERGTNSLLNAIDDLNAALCRNVKFLAESAALGLEETTESKLQCVDDADFKYLLNHVRAQMTANLDMLKKLEVRLTKH